MLPEPAHSIIYAIGDTGWLLAEVLVIAFLISYTGFFAWRKTAAGRAVVYTFIGLSFLVLTAVLVVIFGPDYWGREVVRLVVAWGLVLALARLIWVLWSNFRHGEPPLKVEEREHHRRTDSIPTVKEESDG